MSHCENLWFWQSAKGEMDCTSFTCNFPLAQIESMVERLYTTKPKHGATYKSRPTPMKAIFYIENGAHMSRLEPIPPKPAQERTDFMVRLACSRSLFSEIQRILRNLASGSPGLLHSTPTRVC